MSILGNGRKSEKLILGFEYLASFSNSSSHLTLKSLRIMLLAYLKIICALTSSSTTSTTRRMAILNRVVSAVINAIALYTNLADEMSTVSFEEFSEWYNNGGSEIATWIELVDMEKWFALIPETNETNDETNDDTNETNLLSLFTFNLERYQELNRVLILSKFDTLDPEDVFETFGDFVDGEYVSKAQYDECLRILIPANNNLSAKQCQSFRILSHFLSLRLGLLGFRASSRDRIDSVS